MYTSSSQTLVQQQTKWQKAVAQAKTEYYNSDRKPEVAFLLASFLPDNPNQEIVFKDGVRKSLIEITLEQNMVEVARKLKRAGAIFEFKLEKSEADFKNTNEYFLYLYAILNFLWFDQQLKLKRRVTAFFVNPHANRMDQRLSCNTIGSIL